LAKLGDPSVLLEADDEEHDDQDRQDGQNETNCDPTDQTGVHIHAAGTQGRERALGSLASGAPLGLASLLRWL
jgi:hypothetical protein